MVFNIIHGTPGEDGKLQAYLDMVGVPYNTSSAAITALTFQKFHCNQFLKKDLTVCHAWWRKAFHTPLNSSIISWQGDRSRIFKFWNDDWINMMRKYYFINKFDTNNIDKQDKQTTIIYRNYSTKKLDQKLILKIKKYSKPLRY